MTAAISVTLEAMAEQAKTGDKGALEALVRGLQAPIYRLASRMLGLPEPARDATQEILILIITQLSTFRGESALSTWAYSIATHYLLREKQRARQSTFTSIAEHLGQPPNEIDPATTGGVEERLLAEEVFLGCTQAILSALDAQLRIAFVLGAVCELPAPECASILGIESATFRKRLSRARATLDHFLTAHCGVANPANRCRCRYQVRRNLEQGRLHPASLLLRTSRARTSLDVLQAHAELTRVRDSIELYQAQPTFELPEDFARQVREMLASATTLSS